MDSQAAKFFVYGSICEGFVHFSKIKEFILRQEQATIEGTAYRLKVGYPVVLEEGTDKIPGFLVDLKHNELLISLLDQFHGFNQQDTKKSLYLRKETKVTLCSGESSGEVISAQVYVLNPSKLPATAQKIENGDWKKEIAEKPSFIDQLTERQRTYIQRLGASVGREIVPIDLPLYRELMNLEMIVDKGRRLALSKLGHEVCRYLS